MEVKSKDIKEMINELSNIYPRDLVLDVFQDEVMYMLIDPGPFDTLSELKDRCRQSLKREYYNLKVHNAKKRTLDSIENLPE